MSYVFHLFHLPGTGRDTQPVFLAVRLGETPPPSLGAGPVATHCLVLTPGQNFGGQFEADIHARIEQYGFARVQAFATEDKWRAWRRQCRAPIMARLRRPPADNTARA